MDADHPENGVLIPCRITLRRTFDHWVKVGRGLQLLRQKADQIGTRNSFNDLRDQHCLVDKHFRKEVVSSCSR